MHLTTQQRGALNAVAANREYMRRTGYTRAGQPLWTSEEIEALHRHYPDYGALVAALPGRTRKAIEMKVEKSGLARSRFIWTAAEVARIRTPYRSGEPIAEVCRLVPGKSQDQVYHRANRSGFRRPRRAPIAVEPPIVDAIRQRAFELRISMTDLDAMTGPGAYFKAPRGLNLRKVKRAVKVLDGELTVRWCD